MNTPRIRGSVVRVAVVACGLATSAFAGNLDRTVPLAAGGTARIEVPAGTLVVEGWDRSEVGLSGDWTGDPDAVSVRVAEGRVEIRIEPTGPDRARADLTVRVPRLGALEVEALACDVSARALRADRIDLEVVHGDVTFDGEAERLDLEAVSGRVVVRGRIAQARIEAAAGGVELAGAVEAAKVETLSGPVRVTAAEPLRDVDLSSASGGIQFEGALAPEGVLRAETLNGNVELRLDPATRADVEVETFNGTIDVDWPSVQVGADGSEYGAGKTARFRLGGAGDSAARIQVETFNGGCTIRRR